MLRGTFTRTPDERLSAGCAVLLAILLFPCEAITQDECGSPAPVADETLRGEIESKAQLLSKHLGDASLSGKIEKSRNEIFSKYPDAEQSRWNANFQYQLCMILMRSKTLSDEQKLEKLFEVQREFSKPITDRGDPHATRSYWKKVEDVHDKYLPQAQEEIRNIIEISEKIHNSNADINDGYALSSSAYTASKVLFKMVDEENDIPMEYVDHDLTKFAANSRVKITRLAHSLDILASVVKSVVDYRARGRQPPEYIRDQGDEALQQFLNALLSMQENDEELKLVVAKLIERYGD